MTLLELMVALGIFALLGMVLFTFTAKSLAIWRTVSARDQVERNLWAVEQPLRIDLQQTDPTQVYSQTITSPAGSGDVLWFPIDLYTQDILAASSDSNGGPAWAQNIVYYLVRPTNVAQLSHGVTFADDPSPTGDAYCPYKFMIREVVQLPFRSNREPVIAPSAISTYTKAPNGYDTSSFSSEPGFVSARILSTHMLYFHVTRTGAIFKIDLAAVRLAEARKAISMGHSSLLDSPFTVRHMLEILPSNYTDQR